MGDNAYRNAVTAGRNAADAVAAFPVGYFLPCDIVDGNDGARQGPLRRFINNDAGKDAGVLCKTADSTAKEE
jgi:hypothetical protein